MKVSDAVKSFVPGLQLAEGLYWEVVRPLIDDHFPDLVHAAALIGSGSEVLGFDDKVSTDHHWGPRVMLFLEPEDQERHSEALETLLARRLPYEFRGYPTNFAPPDPNDNGTQLLQPIEEGPVNHRVSIDTLRGFMLRYMGFDVERPLEPPDWLTFPEQHLCSVTAGAVYHDDVGLEAVRSRLSYYPLDVWLYLLAAGWARIGQEEHLMGRAGTVGDEVGSALIGARLVRDIMRLCFLMERTYAPYPKWFGTAFKQLACAQNLGPILSSALRADSWELRERALVEAYEYLAVMHNALGLTDPLPETAMPFHGRPYSVVAMHGFADALLAAISDPAVIKIARRRPIGSIDQFSDSTDLLSDPVWRPLLRRLYE